MSKKILETHEEGGIKRFLGSKIFTLIAVLVVVVIIFSVWSAFVGSNFFAATTLRNILNSLVVSAFLAIGAGCLLIAGEIDLSQAAVGAFGGIVIAAAVAKWHLPVAVAILLTLVICAAFGAFNAMLVNEFNFPSFIGTLAMASVVKGLMMFSSTNKSGTASNIPFKNNFLDTLANGRIGEVPVSVILMLAAFLLYGIIMNKTRFGKKVYLVGGNRMAARMAGINAKSISYILFMNASMLSGMAGLINSARIGQGMLLALQSNQFTGLTAAILGGIMFGGGSGGLGGAFLGLCILITFQSGMMIVNVNPYWVTAFTGLLLILALSLDYARTKKMQNALGMD